MKSNNHSNRSSDYETKYFYSEEMLNTVSKIDGIVTLFLVLVGWIGNLIVVLIYRKKKFRSNPSHIYLMVSAGNDSLFLLVHLFEHVFKMIRDAFFIEDSSLLESLTFVEKYDLACKLVGFMRNVLRFNSAYFVTAYTLHRLLVVCKPLSYKSKSKKFALKVSFWIGVVSFGLNLWV